MCLIFYDTAAYSVAFINNFVKNTLHRFPEMFLSVVNFIFPAFRRTFFSVPGLSKNKGISQVGQKSGVWHHSKHPLS